jgi:hypothetical protein
MSYSLVDFVATASFFTLMEVHDTCQLFSREL